MLNWRACSIGARRPPSARSSGAHEHAGHYNSRNIRATPASSAQVVQIVGIGSKPKTPPNGLSKGRFFEILLFGVSQSDSIYFATQLREKRGPNNRRVRYAYRCLLDASLCRGHLRGQCRHSPQAQRSGPHPPSGPAGRRRHVPDLLQSLDAHLQHAVLLTWTPSFLSQKQAFALGFPLGGGFLLTNRFSFSSAIRPDVDVDPSIPHPLARGVIDDPIPWLETAERGSLAVAKLAEATDNPASNMFPARTPIQYPVIMQVPRYRCSAVRRARDQKKLQYSPLPSCAHAPPGAAISLRNRLGYAIAHN
jgi:hypothetical protein